MSLVDRLASRVGFQRRRALVGEAWPGAYTLAGYSTAVTAVTAENLSAVFGCVSVISTSLASLPALIYERRGAERIEATAHPLLELVRGGPNAHQTWPDFIELLMASTLLSGNGLAAIDRTPSGTVEGLRIIPWPHVTPTLLPSGRIVYDVHEPERGGRPYRLLDTEVLHLRDRSDNGLVGRSRLSRAADTFATAHAVHRFSRAFMDNGAAPSGVISYSGKMQPEAKEELRESFQRRHSGKGNAGLALILDQGLTWQSTQISPEDAELLASRKFSVEEICRIYQMPPPLVQDYSHNTFTNSETAGRWFAQFTLGPWARKIEAEFARSVLPTGGPYELELDLSGFLRGDPATRWNAHKIAIEAGVLDPDEVRAVEGYNPRRAA